MKVSPALFVRQVKQEASKITWPSRAETMQGTIAVLVICLVLAIFLFAVDSVFAGIIHKIIGG